MAINRINDRPLREGLSGWDIAQAGVVSGLTYGLVKLPPVNTMSKAEKLAIAALTGSEANWAIDRTEGEAIDIRENTHSAILDFATGWLPGNEVVTDTIGSMLDKLLTDYPSNSDSSSAPSFDPYANTGCHEL